MKRFFLQKTDRQLIIQMFNIFTAFILGFCFIYILFPTPKPPAPPPIPGGKTWSANLKEDNEKPLGKERKCRNG
jgi:hypothetical protein